MTKDTMKMVEEIMTRIDKDGRFTVKISEYKLNRNGDITNTFIFDSIIFDDTINDVYKGPCVAKSGVTHYNNITPISEIVRFID